MHPVLKLVVQRVALGLILLLAVSLVIFLGTEALPGLMFHNGGVAGYGGSPRMIHPAYFDDVPRYHNGGVAGLLLRFGFHPYPAAIIGIAVGSVWNFALSSRFVWGRY